MRLLVRVGLHSQGALHLLHPSVLLLSMLLLNVLLSVPLLSVPLLSVLLLSVLLLSVLLQRSMPVAHGQLHFLLIEAVETLLEPA